MFTINENIAKSFRGILLLTRTVDCEVTTGFTHAMRNLSLKTFCDIVTFYHAACNADTVER